MNEQNGRFSVQTPLGAPPVLGTQTCYEAPCNLQVKRIFVIVFEEEFVYISKAMIARISTFCIEILKCSQKYYKDILVTVKTFFFWGISPETQRKLYISTKYSHQEIR